VSVTVRLDLSDWERALARLRTKAPQAITRALNRAITSARVVMVREVARDLGIKQATVRDRMSVEQAKPGTERARLSASLKRIPLIEFNARGPEPSRGKGRGVAYRLGGAKRLPHAFIATMRSGHRGVFERVGTRRLPIHELKGPSIGHVFARHVDEGLARGQEALVKNLESEFRFVLRPVAAA
jgi:hypothetical protein